MGLTVAINSIHSASTKLASVLRKHKHVQCTERREPLREDQPSAGVDRGGSPEPSFVDSGLATTFATRPFCCPPTPQVDATVLPFRMITDILVVSTVSAPLPASAVVVSSSQARCRSSVSDAKRSEGIGQTRPSQIIAVPNGRGKRIKCTRLPTHCSHSTVKKVIPYL